MMSDLEGPRVSNAPIENDIELVQQGHREPQGRQVGLGVASFPAVEEIESMNPPRRSKGTRRLRWLVPLSLLVVVAAIVGLAIGTSTDSNKSNSTAHSPGGNNVESPDVTTQESKFQEIVNWLAKEGISQRSSLQKSDTPQYQAAKWLATQDGANLPLPTTPSSDIQSDGYLFMVRYVMALVYSQMNGENWLSGLNFLSSEPVCRWNGDNLAIDHQGLTVEPGGLWCNADGIPHYLDLELNNLAGVIPTEVGLLQTLQYLDMERNGITGMIPTELCNISSLRGMTLKHNELVGSFPSCLDQLADLEFLNLRSNHLSGPIPASFCQLTKMQVLVLGSNKVGGEIPSCLGNLTDMMQLHLADSMYTGQVPAEFSQLANMKQLYLEDNDLNGDIPESFCQLTKMQVLGLGNNNLGGEIPACLGQLTDMVLLHLSDSMYTGQVPAEFSRLSNMEELYLDGNYLDGNPIPTINQMTNLRLLFLEENSFGGVIDQSFARNMPYLQALDISTNNFTSTEYGIPPQIFKLPQLIVLDFSRNKLEGSIPTDVPPHDALRFLSVHDNMLSGPIPSELTNLKQLGHLDLSNNKFQGPMEGDLFAMNNLKSIFLSHNPDLDVGQIPDALVGMKQLLEISLRATGRTGPLPELLGFEDLILLDLGENNFSGSIPASYGNLRSIRYLLLDRNRNVSGVVPDFGGAKQLQTVLLDKTGVTGDMSSICNLQAFSGEDNEVKGDVLAVADCKEEESGIACDCCHCCSKDQEVCSDPTVESFDWTWEEQRVKAARNFLVDTSLLAEPAEYE